MRNPVTLWFETPRYAVTLWFETRRSAVALYSETPWSAVTLCFWTPKRHNALCLELDDDSRRTSFQTLGNLPTLIPAVVRYRFTCLLNVDDRHSNHYSRKTAKFRQSYGTFHSSRFSLYKEVRAEPCLLVQGIAADSSHIEVLQPLQKDESQFKLLWKRLECIIKQRKIFNRNVK